MSSQFIKGAVIITIATIVSKVIGSLYRIPLQNIAGDEVLGIFTIVYPVYMAILTMTVAGIPLAISKLISEANALGKKTDIYFIYRTAAMISLLFGVISFGLVVFFASDLAYFLGGEMVVASLVVVSGSLVIAPYMAVHRGFFQGFEQMEPTAFSQVLEQIVRVSIIILMAYILTKGEYRDDLIAAGVMAGSFFGVLASLIYLLSLFRKRKNDLMKKTVYRFSNFITWGKKILSLSIPICIGALAMALLNMVDSVTIPLQLKNYGYEAQEVTYLFGIYGRGLILVQMAIVLANALVLPLIPHVTKAVVQKDLKQTREIIERTNKFAHFTAWPAAIGLVALTNPINLALFKDLEGSSVIAILSFSSLFTAFAILTTAILQGMDKAKLSAWIVIFCALMKFFLNLLLVSKYGLIGGACSTLVTYIIMSFLNVVVIYRTVPFSFALKNAIFIVSSLIMGIIVFLPLPYLSFETWTRWHAFLYLLIIVPSGFLIYVGMILLFKGITKEEIALLVKYVRKS